MRWIFGPAVAAGLALAGPGLGPAAAQSDGLSETMAQRALAAQGMSEIRDLRREGSSYFGEGRLHGETVRFRADARTGELREPERLSEGQVRTVLQALGYADVEGVELVGETYRLRATRAGRVMALRVDARRGTVIQQEVATE